jgi:hypothetical protein
LKKRNAIARSLDVIGDWVAADHPDALMGIKSANSVAHRFKEYPTVRRLVDHGI